MNLVRKERIDMNAEKVIKINSDLEVERLNEKLSLMEEVIEYSVAETMQRYKKQVKDLETEAITLRAKDVEKDKLIVEKDKLITEIKNSVNSRINFMQEQLRREYEDKHKQSLRDMRKNIRQREVKPKEDIIEQSKVEVDRLQNMYNSLLAEFNKSHENETTIINMCGEVLATIKQLVVNKTTTEEIVKTIDKEVETLQKYSIAEECDTIKNMLDSGHSKKEIAALLYPGIARREQKVQDRINSKYYKEKYSPRP